LRKSAKKIRRKAEASALRKAAAEQALTNLVAEQAALTERIGQLGKRIDVVYRNANVACGGTTKQRDIQRTAELARQDQIRADWNFKANQTSHLVLRQAYLAKAAGEDWDDN
jgi:hypothetical protein